MHQLPPEAFCRSPVHQAEGRPTLHFPMRGLPYSVTLFRSLLFFQSVYVKVWLTWKISLLHVMYLQSSPLCNFNKVIIKKCIGEEIYPEVHLLLFFMSIQLTSYSYYWMRWVFRRTHLDSLYQILSPAIHVKCQNQNNKCFRSKFNLKRYKIRHVKPHSTRVINTMYIMSTKGTRNLSHNAIT